MMTILCGPGGRDGGRGEDNPGKGMMEELALTKDQLKKMDDMRSTHRKEMIPLRAQVQVKEIELQDLFESDAVARDSQRQDRRDQQTQVGHRKEASRTPDCDAPSAHARAT